MIDLEHSEIRTARLLLSRALACVENAAALDDLDELNLAIEHGQEATLAIGRYKHDLNHARLVRRLEM